MCYMCMTLQTIISAIIRMRYSQSIPETPLIVKEHVFTILDDLQHDSYAVQHIRTLIHNQHVNEIKRLVFCMLPPSRI